MMKSQTSVLTILKNQDSKFQLNEASGDLKKKDFGE